MSRAWDYAFAANADCPKEPKSISIAGARPSEAKCAIPGRCRRMSTTLGSTSFQYFVNRFVSKSSISPCSATQGNAGRRFARGYRFGFSPVSAKWGEVQSRALPPMVLLEYCEKSENAQNCPAGSRSGPVGRATLVGSKTPRRPRQGTERLARDSRRTHLSSLSANVSLYG